ncbi:HK97 gp10 family phage protein [Streptosporangium sp. NPDC020145]|uniref:HK97 gp10 family phage protein n=1 Tax=Streptosporangium sp. NPDC020145 TaxID=3154694 RepID=UPI00343894E6
MAKQQSGTDDLRRLVRDLGKLPAEVRKELRPVLRKAGTRARTRAKANASWSRRIPGAIRLSVSFTKRRPGVALRVDGRRAPNARPLENLGKQGTFRHPLFGDRERWVSQRARPFLFSAAQAEWRPINAEIAAAVSTAARKHGFR